jgi:hypothetical protein
MKKFIHRVKEGWLLFSRTMGRFSTIILLTLIYLLIIGPMALCVEILQKYLFRRKKDMMKTFFWRDHISSEPTIEWQGNTMTLLLFSRAPMPLKSVRTIL